MLIETHIPTSQQTNLLRAANVISMRGAPGRLIKLQDVQRLLDDFGIPLQIGADLDKTPEKVHIISSTDVIDNVSFTDIYTFQTYPTSLLSKVQYG